MLVLSMVAVASPAAVAQDDDDAQTVETLENGEDLYLSFGADLGDMTLEEYVEAHADGGNDDANAEVIQYQDVGQVNIEEQAEAVSVAIGEGAEATAIQEIDQQNDNTQDGDATAENVIDGQETTFENVGDVYVVMGNGPNKQFDGWGIVDGDDATVTQTAEAVVAQSQNVSQTNAVQNTTALAYAENESEATAVQVTEQSNLNVQEGSAAATNIYADDYDPDKDNHHNHKKGDNADLPDVNQDVDSTVEQSQEVEQANVFEEGSAVAIAAGDNATATAVQITDQVNLNEQLGTAEAINVLMESAGMHVATASVDADADVVTQDVELDEPEDKQKGDGDGDVSQTAEASVAQYQSVEQANLNLNSSAQAIASNGSEADAVQLTFQENINSQVGSAAALNVFVEDAAEKHDKKGDLPNESDEYEAAVLTETTAATISGDPVEGADRTAFDYDGPVDQLNDVEQHSTAAVEQSQNITQLNYHSNNALAVADGDGDASALQLTIQENENVQVSESNSTSVQEAPVDDDDGKDHDKKGDDSAGKTDAESDVEDDESDDSMPGLGVATALVALLAAAMIALRRQD